MSDPLTIDDLPGGTQAIESRTLVRDKCANWLDSVREVYRCSVIVAIIAGGTGVLIAVLSLLVGDPTKLAYSEVAIAACLLVGFGGVLTARQASRSSKQTLDMLASESDQLLQTLVPLTSDSTRRKQQAELLSKLAALSGLDDRTKTVLALGILGVTVSDKLLAAALGTKVSPEGQTGTAEQTTVTPPTKKPSGTG